MFRQNETELIENCMALYKEKAMALEADMQNSSEGATQKATLLHFLYLRNAGKVYARLVDTLKVRLGEININRPVESEFEHGLTDSELEKAVLTPEAKAAFAAAQEMKGALSGLAEDMRVVMRVGVTNDLQQLTIAFESVLRSDHQDNDKIEQTIEILRNYILTKFDAELGVAVELLDLWFGVTLKLAKEMQKKEDRFDTALIQWAQYTLLIVEVYNLKGEPDFQTMQAAVMENYQAINQESLDALEACAK